MDLIINHFSRIRPIAFVALLLCAWCLRAGAAQKDLRWDEKLSETAQGKSRDLQADIRKMWRAVPLHDEKFYVSPVSAINASDRVFNTIDLLGLTREEVLAQVHASLRSPKYGYAFPFWPVPKEAQVFRFDCGNYGWQFTLVFGRDHKVKKMTRQWIH